MTTPVTSRAIPLYTGDPVAAGIAPEMVKTAADVVDKAIREGRKVHRVTLLPGDGIGFEISNATIKILAGAGAAISWDYALVGEAAIAATGLALPPQTIAQIKETKKALKGPTGTPSRTGKAADDPRESANVGLRKAFDTFQCIRPAKTIEGVPSRFPEKVDVVIFREATQGLYSGKAIEPTPGTMIGLDIVTADGCRRIVEAAFAYAREQGRKKVTLVHKANILPTEGVMLAAFREAAKKYPDIKAQEEIVDAFCMKSILDPTQFDVVVTNNLFGDIISDVYAAIIGSLGVMPGANKGPEVSIYEATHGTADGPNGIVGQNKANPTAMLLSTMQLLHDEGAVVIADRMRHALLNVLADASRRTGDLKGTATASEFTANVIAEIERLAVGAA